MALIISSIFQVELVLNVEELLPWRHSYAIKDQPMSVNKAGVYDKFQYLVWGGERYDTHEALDKFKHNIAKVSNNSCQIYYYYCILPKIPPPPVLDVVQTGEGANFRLLCCLPRI